MREIKFRAFSTAGMNKVLLFDFVENKVMLDDGDFRKLGSIELMQYTGLKDKNGKEIYEGDILQYNKPDGIYCEVKIGFYNNNERGAMNASGVGVYLHNICHRTKQEKKEGFVDIDNISDLRGFNLEAWCNNVDIIGNIYENPELIKNPE